VANIIFSLTAGETGKIEWNGYGRMSRQRIQLPACGEPQPTHWPESLAPPHPFHSKNNPKHSALKDLCGLAPLIDIKLLMANEKIASVAKGGEKKVINGSSGNLIC